jgi:hypothetical protein
MTRTDGHGSCEHCGAAFPYYILHNGFNASAHGYCDRCGITVVLDLVAIQDRLGELPKSVSPMPREIEQRLLPCACGGAFRGRASARCPACHEALSPVLAAVWIEANARGARDGWRWQRSWSGLYALVLAERMVKDPWRE